MAARGAGKPRRFVATAVIALGAACLTCQIARNAAAAEHERHPALAIALWPSHPAVMTDRALLQIASAAAQGRAPPQAIENDIHRIAVRAPLSPAPFVIRGAIAQTRGDDQQAETLLAEARSRDPRSRAARYLLAERYFRTGRVTDGLVELEVLIGLHSQVVDGFLPGLVAYARIPGAIPQLRAFFRNRPRTEASVLNALSSDAANADLVLALATNTHAPNPDWRASLLSQLMARGQYGRAYALWQRLIGVRPAAGLYNSKFERSAAPPPFNWAYAGSSDGIAEADGRGGLDILYYGRARVMLASQILILRAGAYRLAMKVDADDGEPSAIRAAIHCLPGDATLAESPLRRGTTTGSFDVRDACQAVRLDLGGVPGDVPNTTEVTISDPRVYPEGRP